MNKKGFTLIELLAVIVVLAIIMVIAVPQLLNTINNSRSSAWNDNIKMIKKALEVDYSINNATSAIAPLNCKNKETFQNKLIEVADLDTSATEVASAYYDDETGICRFELEPVGQLKNSVNKPVTMQCKVDGCQIIKGEE